MCNPQLSMGIHFDRFGYARNNAFQASFLNQSDFSSLCLSPSKIRDKTSIDISDNKSCSSLKLVTNDFGDYLVQTYVAVFSNFVDFDGCGDSPPEEEPE